MNTMNTAHVLAMELSGLIVIPVLGLAMEIGLIKLSVRLRTSLQWGLICLCCGFLVGAVRTAPRLFAGLDIHSPTLLFLAGAMLPAVFGAGLTEPQEAEGEVVLGASVCRFLMGIAFILLCLLMVIYWVTMPDRIGAPFELGLFWPHPQ